MTGVELFAIGNMAVTVGQFAQVASGVMGALGALSSAGAASSASKYNAAVADRNARIAEQQGAEDERRQRVASAQQLGGMRAAYGASGVDTEGSPLDILEQSALNSELDAMTIRYNTKLKKMGYQESATLDRMNARSARKEGYSRAGSNLLLGVGNAFG